MIKCVELNKSFDNRTDMLKALYENKDKIISLKKSQVYKSHEKCNNFEVRFYHEATKKVYCSKGLMELKGLDEGFLYPVISNTNYVDSHKDAHLDNSMNRTVKNQQGKVHYALDHKLEVGKIIAYPDAVEMMIKDLSWTSLGKQYKGDTQCLLFKTSIQKYTPKEAIEMIELKLPAQHSIRMRYFQVELGIKDRSDDWEDANKEWDDNIEKIVNKDDILEDGYIWFVKELGIVNEGSMLPLGSNDATPLLQIDELKQNTSSNQIELAEKALQDINKFYKHLKI